MSGIAIQADKLSKRYRVGHLVRYRTLRDTIGGALHFRPRLAHGSDRPGAAAQPTRRVPA